jgi:hypothetical protein
MDENGQDQGAGEEEDRGYSWTRADGEDPQDEDEEVLMEGVDDLPLFASEANKEVHAEVQVKEKKLEGVSSELDEHKGRVGIMSEHLKNVQQELLHTQALVDAKTREIETEDHLKQLAERETGRYKQVCSSFCKSFSYVQTCTAYLSSFVILLLLTLRFLDNRS